MKQCILTVLGLLVCAVTLADNGLVNVKSNHDVATTADNLESALNAKGMTVFARINHAQGASGVDMELRPTEVIIFGNPKVGTPLMPVPANRGHRSAAKSVNLERCKQ